MYAVENVQLPLELSTGLKMRGGDAQSHAEYSNKHKRHLAEVEVAPKAYLEELDRQIDEDREALGKKPFDHDDKGQGSGTCEKTESITDPDSGMQCRNGKPDGFYYSDHRTVDSKNNIIVNTHVEPANINDITPIPKIVEEIEQRLGRLPVYMGLDAGYHSAWIAHLLERKGIKAVIGYRRHTHKQIHSGNTGSGMMLQRTVISAR